VKRFPIEGVVHAALNGLLVLEPFSLAEIEKSQDHDHAELVCLVEHALEAIHVVGTQTAVRLQRGVVPRRTSEVF
jgi:hypothetical protein